MTHDPQYFDHSRTGSAPVSEDAVFAAAEPFGDVAPFLGIDGFHDAGPRPLASPIPKPVEATCVDVHRALPVYLDGELAPLQAAAVQAHIAVCGSCQAAQAFQMQLRTTVAQKAFDPMPDEVRSRITKALGFE